MAITINRSKVIVVGAGLVGTSTAFSLITQSVCDEVMLIDINRAKAHGEVMDLCHSIEYLNRNVLVTEGDYTDCKDADIVVITAGPPPKPGQSRLDTLGLSADIVSTIVEPVMKSGFNGIFLVVTNPVDSIAQYVYQLSGLPKQQVLGTGTAIDSARLKHFIGDILHVDPRSIQAYTMGEHGDSQMCPWSLVTVGGKNIMDIVRDNKEYSDIDFNEILYKVTRVGFDILSVKGTTCYGIASAAVGIIKAILYDENSILPVSTLLEGEYGEFDVYAGVPCILNRFGVKDVVEVNMTEVELNQFRASVHVVREAIENLKDRDKKALFL
ncbi:L-lactate dehydrogenase [Lachnoclostridium phytofermentans]|uniref:L-lactate dehydrogenase n=1 Tax=Lachnoclostridium phytofermentans (strain ATCC 700394 / DSM 18823 / ISDg) TaxID=357809 RepID=A9KMQ0_LACP7|nr:L-lactate dehydrogenase [Lachnoclostridium phytofermentans]ABX41495.1 L-lactate dehydrogenase [Lachnoclostridium phytofermentans ISDg]